MVKLDFLTTSVAKRAYIVSTVQAVFLHLVVFTLFLSSWNVSSDDVDTKPKPSIVKAKVLTMADPILARQKQEEEKRKAAKRKADRLKAEQKRKAAEKRKRDAAKRKEAERKKAEAKRKAEQQKKAEAKRIAEKKKLAEKKRKEQEEAKRLAEKKREQELARQLEQERELEIARALEEESQFEQAASDAEQAMAYISLIQERVIQNWHRPLSARNGMQVLLMIQLVPTGEVNNVYVLESSGDAAFDRSALQAVQRVEKFEELRQLPSRIFDAQFRRFRMLFKPEDLDR